MDHLARPSLSLLLAIACGLGPVRGQVTWTPLSPPAMPGARYHHGMVYDWNRDRIVVFGGWNSGTLYGDTWEFDGANWSQRAVAGAPAARLHPGMAYDSARGRTVLFGGAGTGTTLYADTHEWDGTAWVNRGPAPAPVLRTSTAMAYDSARQRTVLYGGAGPVVTHYNDTWEWDGRTWRQITPTGTPGIRRDHAMAFDPERGVTVLFGGRVSSPFTVAYGDTWEWDGATWTRRSPAHSPPPRFWSRLAYDVFRRRIVLFGGYDGTSALGDTWEWDGTDWLQRTPAANPAACYGPGLAFDIARERVVMFGGYTGSALNTTWRYGTQVPAGFTAFGAGCPGSSGVPALTTPFGHRPYTGASMRVMVASARPASPAFLFVGGSDSVWQGVQLPLPLAGFGAPLCRLLVSPDVVATTATDTGGGAALVLRVPDDPSLAGSRFFVQWSVYDPAANALQLAFSGGAQARIGLP